MSNSEPKTGITQGSGIEDDDGMPDLEGKCIICDTGTLLRCTGCVKGGKPVNEIPFYCGKEHQKKHWKYHKGSCGLVKTESNSGWKEIKTAGKNHNLPYFVASEQLQPGHTLFTKELLLAFPKVADAPDMECWCNELPDLAKQVRQSRERRLWTCISCYEMMIYGELIQDPLHGVRMNKCTSCGWPVHSNIIPGQPPSSCQDAHAEECRILTANGLTWEKEKVNEHGVYYHLGLLRAVLLPPILKKELMNLPVFCPQNLAAVECTGQAIDFVRRKCKLSDQASEEELRKMFAIMFSNLIGPPGSNYSIRRILAFTIYRNGRTGRILPHDCSSNCEVSIYPKTLSAIFKTIRKVEKDEMLAINYIGESSYKPINERFVTFIQHFMDCCSCRRCTDATEGGSFLSAIKCPTDKKSKKKRDCQYLVPTPKAPGTRGGINDIFIWRCLCRSCPGVTKQETVQQLIGSITIKIERAAGLNDYHGLKSIVKSHSGKIVHPTHFVMIYAYMSIAGLASKHIKNLNIYRDPKFKFNLHSNFLPDFDKVIEVLTNLQPGRSDRLGVFLFCQTILKMSELAQKTTTPRTKPNTKELDIELESILRNLQESWICVKASPIVKPMDLSRKLTLQQLYANHLATALYDNMKTDACELENYKLLREKYCAQNVSLDMTKEELRQRQWIVIPPEEIPKFLKEAAEEI